MTPPISQRLAYRIAADLMGYQVLLHGRAEDLRKAGWVDAAAHYERELADASDDLAELQKSISVGWLAHSGAVA